MARGYGRRIPTSNSPTFDATVDDPCSVYRGPVSWGLLGAFAAAASYGVGTVLQAIGARRGGAPSTLDASLVRRLLHSTPYVTGLSLDAIGFGLSLAALRTLPLFTVQAIVASNLAVTAILAVAVLGARPAGREWIALVAVMAGLVLLATSARHQSPTRLPGLDRALLVLSVAVVGGLAFLAARGRGTDHPADVWALGALAGLMYGGAAIGARILHTPSAPWRIFTDPALYAMALAGVLGMLLYAMALQRGAVTVVTASVVVAETMVPALIGLALLGDRPAHGGAVLAGAGFALAVGGAVALARFGDAADSPVSTYSDFGVGTLPAP
jgi:drug/metabolite transporter (DMT)-like permease